MTITSEEDWKNIPGYPYQASSLGRIRRSEKARRGSDTSNRVIATRAHSRGYLTVTLYPTNGQHKQVFVHRAVAAAFFGEDARLVNHKNGTKTDNQIDNLEYVTARENVAHAILMGLAPPRRKLGPIEVVTIRADRKAGRKLEALAKEFNVSASTIGLVCRGKTYTDIAL